MAYVNASGRRDDVVSFRYPDRTEFLRLSHGGVVHIRPITETGIRRPYCGRQLRGSTLTFLRGVESVNRGQLCSRCLNAAAERFAVTIQTSRS